MEDVQRLVDRQVEELLRAAGIGEPPVDAIALAQEHLGMTICLDRTQPQRGRAQRVRGRPKIIVRPEPTRERHQWTVAHEIGEHLRNEMLAELRTLPEDVGAMSGESLANLFAYRLLVPQRWFAPDAKQLQYDVLALKLRYHTASHEVIAWRLLDLPEPCAITIMDNGHVHRRRSNAWRVKRQLSAAEAACQEYVHYYSRPHYIREAGWQCWGWPVHQADWKREILRGVAEEECEGSRSAPHCEGLECGDADQLA